MPYGKNLADPRYDQKDDVFSRVLSHASKSSYSPSLFSAFHQTDILELLL